MEKQEITSNDDEQLLIDLSDDQPPPSIPSTHTAGPPTNVANTISISAGVKGSPFRTESSSGLESKNTVHDSTERELREEDDSQSEIKSIIDQFQDTDISTNQTHQSDQTERSLSDPFTPPPRISSLEGPKSASPSIDSQFSEAQISTSSATEHKQTPAQDERTWNERRRPATTPDRSSIYSVRSQGRSGEESMSPRGSISIHNKALPPEPDPEPDLPFDFHRFLEQLRHRTADPVAKFLRSFLNEFGKKQWMVHEQVKLISDFLLFISNRMAQCEVWQEVSDAEFDNAKEGMEKLVMTRLYNQTFSPAIPPPAPIPILKGKKKTAEKTSGPGRRGQHQEDIERDDVLNQKVQIYGWVKEEHLDIPPVGERGKRFLVLAQQELLKIKGYRAPRDKVICVLNCCKVIFGFLRDGKAGDTSADSFVPLLIYVVLQANPEHLVSNVQYIWRFRNQEKLGGEAGYYLSSLLGAIQFIENLDRTALTVSDDDFEKYVEEAVAAITEKHKTEQAKPSIYDALNEKAEPSRPELTPRSSMETEWRPGRSSTDGAGNEDAIDENAAVTGLLRTIKQPLSSIGRIFSDGPGSSGYNSGNVRLQQVQPQQGAEPPRRLSPAVFQPPRNSAEARRSQDEGRDRAYSPGRLTAGDAAARQASREAAEAHRIQVAEHGSVVE
ncbi:hypothetical protein MMC25_006549 [Agyrium rufum]|nr:hypothetical protein [Agyrium rufum]